MPELDLPPIFCKQCGYCLYALPTNRCPECGREFDPADDRTFLRRPRRKVRRWVLWLAMFLLLLALVPAGGWTYLYMGWRAEQPVLVRLRAKRTDITTSMIGPAWLQQWMPKPMAFVLDRARIVQVWSTYDATGKRVDCPPVTDEDLKGLGALDHLVLLTIDSPQVTDLAFPEMGRLKRLQVLILKCGWSARGMESLRRLNVEWLGLAPTSDGVCVPFDDAIPTVLELRHLKRLQLRWVSFKSGSLRRLADHPALQEFELFPWDGDPVDYNALRQARPDIKLWGPSEPKEYPAATTRPGG